MNVDQLLSLFRNQVDDNVEPYFLRDCDFYIYLTDAINQFCEYGRGIRDHTSSLTEVEYEADNPWIEYDERIKKIISAFDSASGRKLRVIDWDTYQRGDDDTLVSTDYGVIDNYVSYPDKAGELIGLFLGMDESKIRLYQIPAVKGTIKFVLDRYPLKAINENNQTIEGVPVTDRIHLLDWVKFRYYDQQDGEQFDPDKAEASRISFLNRMPYVDSRDMIRTKKKGATKYGGL